MQRKSTKTSSESVCVLKIDPNLYPNIFESKYWMNEYPNIFESKYWTNEYPNIFVSKKLTRTNIWIYSFPKIIRMNTQINIWIKINKNIFWICLCPENWCERISEYICIQKMIQKNTWINIRIKNIQIFKYSNIFVTLWFRSYQSVWHNIFTGEKKL